MMKPVESITVDFRASAYYYILSEYCLLWDRTRRVAAAGTSARGSEAPLESDAIKRGFLISGRGVDRQATPTAGAIEYEGKSDTPDSGLVRIPTIARFRDDPRAIGWLTPHLLEPAHSYRTTRHSGS
jgi:hypothetical protein